MEIDVRLINKYKRKSRTKESSVGALFLSPFIINFIIFSIIPIGFGIVISFFNYDPYNPDKLQFVGFQNYAYVFDILLERIFGEGASIVDVSVPYSRYFWDSFKTTLIFDLIAVPFLIIIPLALAYLINMNPPGGKLFRAILYVPSVVSISIVGIIFGNMFGSEPQSFINSIFGTEINWLNNRMHPELRWVVILIASIWWQTGGNFIILLAALKNVPRHLYEACEIDGGSKWKAFTKVTLPNIKGSISICLFTTIIGYLGLYGQVTVLTGPVWEGTYDSPMQLIQYLLSNPGKGAMTGYITAIAVIFGLITMFFTAIEKILTADRKKGDKHAKRYYSYYAKEKNA